MKIIRNIAGALALLIVLCGASHAVDYPQSVNERNVLQAVRTLRNAEVAYLSTYGNGLNYGSLNALRRAHLIDASLATGNKYGYIFVVLLSPGTPTSSANFTVTATPRIYRPNARWSFFVDARGEIRGADKGGEPATETDPIIDECTLGSVIENEQCVIRSMRTVHSAEVTYYAISNDGSYGGLSELRSVGLIDESLASGQLRGYLITVTAFPRTPTESARYRATAVPQIYGITGIRSFFVDDSGVIRAADHQGGPANENDPPLVDGGGGGSITENEQRAISSMRTIHSAEITWFATSGNNMNYTGLAGLANAGLIDAILASGQRSGYSFSVVVVPQTPTEPAGYRAYAVPQLYGRTGRRSFFVNEYGVIYGADHHGGPANENDPSA
jgi:hypothetical protein